MKTRVAAGAMLLVFTAWQAFGQPAFEVADIKPSASPNALPSKGGFQPGGRVDIRNTSIKEMIMGAYGVQMDMISGGPKWIDSDRFDIVAKADPDTPTPTLLLMLRTLLEDRFKLVIHREDKVMPVYVLTVAKSGPKLKENTDSARSTCAWSMPGNDRRRRECRNMHIADLARTLPGLGGPWIDRPVVDLTELKGSYDFQFEIGIRARGGEGNTAPEDAGPTIFDAMGQLGLKLDAAKRPMSIVVIDRLERVPTEN